MLGISGDQIPLGMVIFYVRNPVLLIGVIDFVSAIYHFIHWNRNGKYCMDDDDNGLFSDWKSGERSPVKISLVLMAGRYCGAGAGDCATRIEGRESSVLYLLFLRESA